MESLISKFNTDLLETNEGDVQIIVYDPNCEFEIMYTYYTYRHILEKSPVFKNWFDQVDFYGDYIEIGSNDSHSNLMLFNKTDDYSYCLTINYKNTVHLLGNYTPPLIKHVINYLNDGKMIVNNKDFLECLKILQIN